MSCDTRPYDGWYRHRAGRNAYGLRALCFAVAAAILVLGLAAASSAAEPATRSSLPFDRAQKLSRTINIWRWFASPSISPGRADYVSDKDLAQIRAWGFTAVRLPIGDNVLFSPDAPSQLNPQNLQSLDNAVERIRKANLAVIVDFHSRARDDLESSEPYRRAVIAFWSALARHASQTYDPDYVMLELLNEPRFIRSDDRWQTYQQELVSAVRAAAPNFTLIVTASNYSAIDRLVALSPLPDRNLIYTIHFYEPQLFTTQGAEFTKKDARGGISLLPYPADRRCPKHSSSKVWSAQDTLIGNYCHQGWNKQRLADTLQPAVAWARANHVPLFVGEFGVRSQAVNPADRVMWLAGARQAFESASVPWGLFSYDDCFGLAMKAGDQCSTALNGNYSQAAQLRDTLQALGLPRHD